MSVGAVGGAGGGGGAAGAVGGASGGGGAAAVGSSGGASAPAAGKSTSSSKVDMEHASKGGINNSVNMAQNSNFSTKDLMSLRETSNCQPVKKSPAMDMQKLIEMMMAIQLLEKMNEMQNK